MSQLLAKNSFTKTQIGELWSFKGGYRGRGKTEKDKVTSLKNRCKQIYSNNKANIKQARVILLELNDAFQDWQICGEVL